MCQETDGGVEAGVMWYDDVSSQAGSWPTDAPIAPRDLCVGPSSKSAVRRASSRRNEAAAASGSA